MCRVSCNRFRCGNILGSQKPRMPDVPCSEYYITVTVHFHGSAVYSTHILPEAAFLYKTVKYDIIVWRKPHIITWKEK